MNEPNQEDVDIGPRKSRFMVLAAGILFVLSVFIVRDEGLGTDAMNRMIVLEKADDAHSENMDNTIIGKGNTSSPQVVWLLSFPNSGTSFTITNLEELTNQSTASNYAEGWDQVIPVGTNDNGPFYKGVKQLPSMYVLTKTHCAGYCTRCGPSGYIQTSLTAFQSHCGRAERNDNENKTVILTEYPAPKRAIHLVRNPLDNIVSRMHLALKPRHLERDSHFVWIASLPSERERLTAWCNYTNHIHLEQFRRTNLLPSVVKHEIMQSKFPCSLDLFRYIQWHNMVCEMTTAANMTVLYVQYESYGHNLSQTTDTILDFLNMKRLAPGIDFAANKTYESLYSSEEKMAASMLIKALATPKTYHLLENYL